MPLIFALKPNQKPSNIKMTHYVDAFDLKKMKKKLEGFEALGAEELGHLLDVVAKYRIDKQLLSDSSIHVTLGKIAKNKNEKAAAENVDKAVKIRSSWKQLLQSSKAEGLPAPDSPNAYQREEELFDENKNKKRPAKPQAGPEKPKNDAKADEKPKFVEKVVYDDKVRGAIFNALKDKARPYVEDEEELSGLCKDIEQAIYQACDQLKVEYKKHARERVLILSDKEHQKEIIAGLSKGLISFSDFAEKEPRELLSKNKLKEMEEKARGWLMAAMQSDFYMRNTEIKDSEFQCPKCKNRKIYAAQKQTRSADEPMTTFFKCLNCDYHWKMN